MSIEPSSRRLAQRLYDGTRCTICGEEFQVGDSITEVKATRAWSAFEAPFDGELEIRYHPVCMEEVLSH